MMGTELALMAAEPFIQKLTDKFTSKVESFVENAKLEWYKNSTFKRGVFEEYLNRVYIKYGNINTLVCRNTQRKLKDLYIPLTITKDANFLKKNEEEKIKISEFPQRLIQKYQKVLIVDAAGMGKSTVTKRMFLDVIENGNYGIPMYIELRKLSQARTILDEIKSQVSALDGDFDNKLLLGLIQTGDFVFFLDGFDEIPLTERQSVTADLQDFVSKAGNNHFILTSRPEHALVGFGDFQSFKIESLEKKEAYELLRKYDEQGETAKRLITELESGKHKAIEEFLANPLLVSLLFVAYDYGQVIPLKKTEFYSYVYKAYFDKHDFTKEVGYTRIKRSKLGKDDFERVLRRVAFTCLKKHQISFEGHDWIKMIEEAKVHCANLNFSASDFLDDLTHAVPLCCEDGVEYKWVHKSLQEYFAAKFIYLDAESQKDKILTTLYNNEDVEQYINILDIYSNLDVLGFERNIVMPFCIEYINYYNQQHVRVNFDNQEVVDDRIAMLFCINRILLFPPDKLAKKGRRRITSFFDKVRDEFQSITGERCNGIISSRELAVAFCESKKRLLLPLFESSICKQYLRVYHQIDFNEDYYEITIESGKENLKEYEKYNSILFKAHIRPAFVKIIDINKCQNELKRIQAIIKRNSNEDDLLAGL